MHNVFHILQFKPIGINSSCAHAVDNLSFCPAADKLDEYEVKGIHSSIALMRVIVHHVLSMLSSGMGTLCWNLRENGYCVFEST